MASPQEYEDGEIATVAVTGSRIGATRLEGISPVSTITSEDVAASGKVRVEDLVNQLPQAFAAQGAAISNGASGTATVDLRGLGAKRTLVLVNGRRLVAGNPDSHASANAGAADLNFIPAALIERVELLTGGASAVYGADAVGGVVNFILDTDFEGLRFDVNYSLNRHGNDNAAGEIVRGAGLALPADHVRNGYTRDVSLLAGARLGEDRGHVTFYATYRDVEEVLQADYDYSACALMSGDAFTCGGSGTAFPGRFLPYHASNGRIAGDFTLDGGSGVRNYEARDAYNFAPLNFYQRPDRRYTSGLFVDYDLGERSSAYSELMFMDDRSTSQIAPSGAFLRGFSIACGNPLWSAEQRAAFCGAAGLDASASSADVTRLLVGRRNVEGGPRQEDIEHESYRAVLGVRGDLTRAWSYDVHAQTAAVRLASTYRNDFSVARTARALDVVVHPATGLPACRSVVDGTDLACVPWNIWSPGAVTPQALDYLQTPLVQTGRTGQRLAAASLSGDLGAYGMKLPHAETGLLVSVGAEWREERATNLPDAAYQAGDGAGQGGPRFPIAGDYAVRELFAEARVPIAEDARFAELLAAEAGYRFSDYDLGFATDTYKAGIEWAPVADVRGRASLQRAVRVPNVSELYSVRQVGIGGTMDVCAGRRPLLSLEECARTGVTPEQYGRIAANSASQYNALMGGNPELRPEVADTISFGLAFKPRFVRGLRLHVDYFDIRIDGPVQNPHADFTLLQCARSGDPGACGKVQRDEFGSLWLSHRGYIVDTLDNIGEIRTSGIDVDASWEMRVGELGRMKVDFIGTLLERLEYSPQANVSFDCAGLFGGICGSPAPGWRHKLDALWSAPWGGLELGFAWRYFGSASRDAEDANEFLRFFGQATGALATDARVGSRSYLDLNAAFTFGDAWTLRAGVNNVFDKDPPLVGGSSCPLPYCNGNTWPQIYDALGRQAFATLTIDF